MTQKHQSDQIIFLIHMNGFNENSYLIPNQTSVFTESVGLEKIAVGKDSGLILSCLPWVKFIFFF